MRSSRHDQDKFAHRQGIRRLHKVPEVLVECQLGPPVQIIEESADGIEEGEDRSR